MKTPAVALRRRIKKLENALVRAITAHGHDSNCSAARGMERDCHCGWLEVKQMASRISNRRQPPSLPESPLINSVMPKVNGKPFRCHCGCNVFHHPPEKPEVFECNACEEWYTGEA